MKNISILHLMSPTTTHHFKMQYLCQWVSESVIDSFRFGDSYHISELCELVRCDSISQHLPLSRQWDSGSVGQSLIVSDWRLHLWAYFNFAPFPRCFERHWLHVSFVSSENILSFSQETPQLNKVSTLNWITKVDKSNLYTNLPKKIHDNVFWKIEI